MSPRRNPWVGIGFDAWRLGIEASGVIAQRTLKLSTGGASARAEALRMVSEKVDAGVALQRLALTGGLGVTPAATAARTLAHYRRKVRANSRRHAKT